MESEPTEKLNGMPHMARAAAANDVDFTSMSPGVRVLRLNRGAERVRRKGERKKTDELWVGTGYCKRDDLDLALYLRLTDARSIAAELISSVIGRALGLPIPEPFIVAIERRDLPSSRLLQGRGTTYTFGCQALAGHDFAQLLTAEGDEILSLLLSWKHLVPAATFDEWLANTDRNFGNIVFAAQSLWLIDHAEALAGTQGRLFGLKEQTTERFANKLADVLDCLDHAARDGHLQQAKRWLNNAAAVNLDDAWRLAGLDRWHSGAEQTALLEFVRQRLTITHSLLCNRLGHPQLSLSPAMISASPAGEPSLNSAPA
jgi:hypothetical protein